MTHLSLFSGIGGLDLAADGAWHRRARVFFVANSEMRREQICKCKREAARRPCGICGRPVEPGMGGMADGIPNWLDGEPAGIPRIVKGLPHRADRIKALGNAVVPQQAYPIFRAIRMIEEAE